MRADGVYRLRGGFVSIEGVVIVVEIVLDSRRRETGVRVQSLSGGSSG